MGNHAFFYGIAEADAKIESFANKMVQAVVDGNIEADVRILAAEFRIYGLQDGLKSDLGEGEAYRARCREPVFAGVVQCIVECVEGWLRLLQQLFARIRERDGACAAFEQGCA